MSRGVGPLTPEGRSSCGHHLLSTSRLYGDAEATSAQPLRVHAVNGRARFFGGIELDESMRGAKIDVSDFAIFFELLLQVLSADIGV